MDPEDLLKFKKLLDAGAISQDEYDVKKAEVLQGSPKPALKKSDSDRTGKIDCHHCGKEFPISESTAFNEEFYCSTFCVAAAAAQRKNETSPEQPQMQRFFPLPDEPLTSSKRNKTRKPGELHPLTILAVAACCGLLFYGLIFTREGTNFLLSFTHSPDASQTSSVAAATAAWNVGGTLHQATDKEWIAATAENQLATSADFAASAKDRFKFTDEAGMKVAATAIDVCISAAAQSGSGQKVSTLAAACILQLAK